MKVQNLILVSLLFALAASITKLDFNTCRIDFCVDKQSTCVADEADCLKAFADTRKCFASCTSEQQLETYNLCWADCQQSSAIDSNNLYKEVAQCYEELCYLSEKWVKLASLAFVNIVALLMIV